MTLLQLLYKIKHINVIPGQFEFYTTEIILSEFKACITLTELNTYLIFLIPEWHHNK
jgi:hypothetical protein